MVNGYSIVTFQRPLKATDKFDLPISLNGSQAIVWAIGPLNQRQEVSFHSQYTNGDRLIDFGRQAVWNCPLSEGDMKLPDDDVADELYDEHTNDDTGNHRNENGNRRHQQDDNRRHQQEQPSRGPVTNNRNDVQKEERPSRRPVPTPKPASRNGAWGIPPIECDEPEDGVFYAQMGPTGGKQGYPAITGHVGWGISWYINGLLIPEINVVRGQTYTFVTEGGSDPEIPAKYHPFYITDDSVGGYEYKTDEEKAVCIQLICTQTRERRPLTFKNMFLCRMLPFLLVFNGLVPERSYRLALVVYAIGIRIRMGHLPMNTHRLVLINVH